MTEKDTPTETKRNESIKQISTTMRILALMFFVLGGFAALGGVNLVFYALFGINLTFFDYVVTLIVSIPLIIVGFILWYYAPEE